MKEVAVAEQERPMGVVPSLWVDAVEPLRDFYLNTLGFRHRMGIVGKDGKLDFAIVTRDGSMVMMGRPTERIEGTGAAYPTGRPVELYVHASDIDAYHDEIRGRGVAVSSPLTSQWWGDRTFSVKDPYGYVIWFYQPFGPPVPPPGVTML
jgi:PhnB protein